MRRLTRSMLSFMLMLVAGVSHAQSVGSAFTYQGELRAQGQPANTAHDFQFRLFNAASGGAQVGPTVTLTSVGVVNGLFTVPLDFGPAQFAGDAQWLEIAVRPSTGGAFETLVPRNAVTPAPYALGAVAALANSVTGTSIVDGSVQAADLAAGAVGTSQVNPAQVQRRVGGTCTASQGVQSIAQDGTVVCGTFGTGTIIGVGAGTGLAGGGSSGSVVLGIANGGVGSAQIDASQVQTRVSGSCTAGQYVRQVNQDGTVACGTDATGPAGWTLSGNAGTTPGTNYIGTNDAQAFEIRTFAARALRIDPSQATTPDGPIAVNLLAGSFRNAIAPGVLGATIAGGGSAAATLPTPANRVFSDFSVIGGGSGGTAGSDGLAPSQSAWATVAGGSRNSALAEGSTVGGGAENRALGSHAMVGGGLDNQAVGEGATVAGGVSNAASSAALSSGAYVTIGGGFGNVAEGFSSTIVGGRLNRIGERATGGSIGGGTLNTVLGANASVPGGSSNVAGGEGALAAGDSNCAGGDYSWAIGRNAKVRSGMAADVRCIFLGDSGDFDGDEGTFVWSDASGGDFQSDGPNQFAARASGGFFFGGAGSSVALIPAGRFINTSTGAHLTTGGSWTNASSRALKTAFEAIDPGEVLARVLALPLSRWRYRDSASEGTHLGPVAEDFHAAFGLGADGRAISTVDADGVALAAIQGLNAKLEAENAALRSDLEALRAEVRALAEGRAR